MLNIYVASTNRTKTKAVEEVFLFGAVQSIPVKIDIYQQPKSDHETLIAARKRICHLPKDGIKIALEGGIHEESNHWFIVNWGVMVDQHGIEYIASGRRIPLPNVVVKDVLENNRELSDAMDEYAKTKNIREKNGAIGFLSNNRVVRKDEYVGIATLLLGQYEKRRGETL